MRSTMLAFIAGAGVLAVAQPSLAEKKYGPGVTDTEIKIGQTMPYSGPVSPVSIAGRVQVAYFKMLNSKGGINGRKIDLISLDDSFSPPKTVEMTRKLVEDDGVLAIVSALGTSPNLAIAKYLNGKQVPHILSMAATLKLTDPVEFPWSTTFYASSVIESKIYARYLLDKNPSAKVAILYQNDDYGKGYLEAFKAALGPKASMVIKEVSYDLSDPTIDSQILTLQASGADTFFQAAQNKFAAQAIRKVYDIGWKPMQIMIGATSQISSTLRPAGLERAVGIITARFSKDPGDPRWEGDPGMQEYLAFLKEWAPNEPADDSTGAYAYAVAQMAVEMLKRCGDELTRENLMKQATNVTDFQLPLFIPGVKINIKPNSRVAWKQAQMVRFDGTNWQFVGDIITVDE